MFSNLNLNDMESGYKVFHSSILNQIKFKSNKFGFEPEFTMKVAKLGCRIFQVPISYSGRTYQEGKKITWRDGCAAFWHILRFRFMDTTFRKVVSPNKKTLHTITQVRLEKDEK